MTNEEFNQIDNAKEMVDHPDHYKIHDMECIDEMIIVFGPERTAQWCCQTAWKYRYRAGAKGSEEEDQKKADWYLKKAKQIMYGRTLFNDEDKHGNDGCDGCLYELNKASEWPCKICENNFVSQYVSK